MGFFGFRSKTKTAVLGSNIAPLSGKGQSLRGTIFALGQMERSLRCKNDPALRAHAALAIKRLKDEKAIDNLLSFIVLPRLHRPL